MATTTTLEFVQNPTTKMWECETMIEGTADVRVVQEADVNGRHRNTVSLSWKGQENDEGYSAAEGSIGTPANGVWEAQVVSEFYPVWLKIEATSEPVSARLTTDD
jgi:hypothetical protein